MITKDYLAKHGETAFLWPHEIIETTRKEVASLLTEIVSCYSQPQSKPQKKNVKDKNRHIDAEHMRRVMTQYAEEQFHKHNPEKDIPRESLSTMVKWRQKHENCWLAQKKPTQHCCVSRRTIKAARMCGRTVCDSSGMAESFQCRWNPKHIHDINDALFITMVKHNVFLCEWELEDIPSTGDCGFFALFKAVQQKFRNAEKFKSCDASLAAQVPATLEQFRLIVAKAVTNSPTLLQSFVGSSKREIQEWNLLRNIVPEDELVNAPSSSEIWTSPVFDLISTPAYWWNTGVQGISESLYLTDDMMEAIQDMYGLKILVRRTQEMDETEINKIVDSPGQCTDAISKWPDFRWWPESAFGYVLIDFDESHFDLYSCRKTGLCILTGSELMEKNSVKACFPLFCMRYSMYRDIIQPYWYDRISKKHYRGLQSLGDLRPDCLFITDLNDILTNIFRSSETFAFQCYISDLFATRQQADAMKFVVTGGAEMEVTSSSGMSSRVNTSTDGVMITLEKAPELSSLNGVVLLAMYLGLIMVSSKEIGPIDDSNYCKVFITYKPQSGIWKTEPFKEWMKTHGFKQAGRKCTFGGRVMPSNVKYYYKLATNDEASNTGWLSSESDDPDESHPKHDATGSSTVPKPNTDGSSDAQELYDCLLKNLSESDKEARVETEYDTGRLSKLVNEVNGFWRDEDKWKEHKKKRKKLQFMLHPDTKKQHGAHDTTILCGCNHIFQLLDELYNREKNGDPLEGNVIDLTMAVGDEEADCPKAQIRFTGVPTKIPKPHARSDVTGGFDQRIPRKKSRHSSFRKHHKESSEEDSDWESIWPNKTKG